MVEVGERAWGRAWPALYGSLGGNPWAAMPSLHFATSLLAAILLSEAGPLAGAAGWTYAATLALRARLPRGALRDRPGRGRGAGRGRAAAEPALGRAPGRLRISDALQRLERVANG